MNRREFIGAAVAASAGMAATGSAHASEKAALPVPEGARFAGMAGAYSAMYTPFFRGGEKAGQLNEEMIERLIEYAVKMGLTGMYLTGSTGEGFLLSLDERKRVYSRAVKVAVL